MEKITVISLGGSLLVEASHSTSSRPENKININKAYIKKISALFLLLLKQNTKNRLAIIVGGGGLCREYQEAARIIKSNTKSEDLDWIGIYSTRLNASLINAILKPHTPADLYFPSEPSEAAMLNALFKKYKCLVSAGTKPGSSSDSASVDFAEYVKSKTIINCTNVDYVYSADPRKNKNVEPIKEMTWAEYLKLIGTDFKPGGSWPFDPIAAKKAKGLKMIVKIVNGNNLKEVINAIGNKKFNGTLLRP